MLVNLRQESSKAFSEKLLLQHLLEGRASAQKGVRKLLDAELRAIPGFRVGRIEPASKLLEAQCGGQLYQTTMRLCFMPATYGVRAVLEPRLPHMPASPSPSAQHVLEIELSVISERFVCISVQIGPQNPNWECRVSFLSTKNNF